MNKYGVIDLGTNTFHLLIMELLEDGRLIEHYRHRIFVKLAENGIQYISKAPFERGLSALQQFKYIIDQHGNPPLKAYGTAALRTATNAPEFIAQIKAETAINIDIIPGKEEARLIYQGVRRAVILGDTNSLIMDIGGGSVEFIMANKNNVRWSESFPIGVAVLTQQFHQEDPISSSSITALTEYLDTILLPLRKMLTQFPIEQLIGASGTFDVLETIMAKKKTNPLISTFPVSNYYPFHDQLISSTLQERLQIESIPPSRAEMIVSALLLIQYVLKISSASQITVSSYAMKEGMLYEMIAEIKKNS